MIRQRMLSINTSTVPCKTLQMARGDGRYFICMVFTCQILCFYLSDSTSVLQDLSSALLEKHIKSSRHTPICVLYKNFDTDGIEEGQKLTQIWKEESANASYTKWHLGCFSFYRKSVLVESRPTELPAVKCYIGEKCSFEYDGRFVKKDLRYWLHSLVTKYDNQLQEGSVYLVNEAVRNYSIVIVAFPDNQRHHAIEEMVAQMSHDILDCKAFIVHPNSLQNQDLRSEFHIKGLPAVLVISKHGMDNEKPVHRIFQQHYLQSNWLEIYLAAIQIKAHHYTSKIEFDKHVMETGNETRYIPKFITFYSYFEKKASIYLSAYKICQKEFEELGVELEFGIVDLALQSGKDILSKYLRSSYFKEIPFSILYYHDSSGRFQKMKLMDDRPTPMSVYNLLESAGVNASDGQGRLFVQRSFRYEDIHQMSSWLEGPSGTMCSARTANATANTSLRFKEKINQKKMSRKQTDLKSWHEKFASESIDRQLKRVDNIPVISTSTWSEVIEKSHAPLHPFQGGKKWAGEVTKVALVIFLKSDCRSCSTNMNTFKQLQKSVRFIEGGSLYLVNCSTDPSLCHMHNIRGFPYITAFRGLGWLDASHCMSDESRTKYKDYIRLDYHGVIQEKPIMEWFTFAAGSSVINRMLDWPQLTGMTEDVRLLGVLMPKRSKYLPIPPNRNQDYYFSYKCFRLACERLHGKVLCNSVYSLEIPEKEFSHDDLDVIVSKIILQRRDGVSAVVTELGISLMSTLEKEAESNIHTFHKPHKYDLKVNQKCEDNHAACTDFILGFTLDHSRLPITHINSDAFHTVDRPTDGDLPMIIALAYEGNLTDGSSFLQTLTNVAYELYNDIIVATLDVEQYPAWAGQFVPANYRKIMVESDGDPENMYKFPRFCFVEKQDHKKAAFYPPRGQNRKSTDWFTKKKITSFAKKFLKNKNKFFERTEHF